MLVVHLVAGCEEEDGDLLVVAADLPRDAEAVLFGEHDVEDTHFPISYLEGCEGTVAVAEEAGGKTFDFEVFFEDVAEVEVVFGKEDAGGVHERGRVMWKVEPWAGSERRSMVPPWAWTMALT